MEGGIQGWREGYRDGGRDGWRGTGMDGERDTGMEEGIQGWREGWMEGYRDGGGGMDGWRDTGMEGYRDGRRDRWRDARTRCEPHGTRQWSGWSDAPFAGELEFLSRLSQHGILPTSARIWRERSVLPTR